MGFARLRPKKRLFALTSSATRAEPEVLRLWQARSMSLPIERLALDCCQDALLLISANGIIEFSNASFAKKFSYDREHSNSDVASLSIFKNLVIFQSMIANITALTCKPGRVHGDNLRRADVRATQGDRIALHRK